MGKTVTYLILCSSYFVNIEITNEAAKELFVGQGQIIETRIFRNISPFSMVVDYKRNQIWSLFLKIVLTLMRATSGSLARCGGGWPPPPLSILALEQILAQKSCSPKSWHQFQLIWPLFRIFFPKITKKLAKIKNLSKIAKNV